MKIIASTEKGYLVEISFGELRKIGITGHLGDEVDLANVLEALQKIDHIGKAHLKTLGKDIERLSEVYNDLIDSYDRAVLLRKLDDPEK